MKQQIQSELAGRKLLGLLVVTGLAFSGLSGFILSDGFGIIQSSGKTNVADYCENGLCNIDNLDANPLNSFVQQNEETDDVGIPISTEIFSNLKMDKNKVPVKDYELFGNNAILFAEKDSFIREGVKNTNEGSNEILRVMGSGPTNNRAIVAFSQDEIESVSEGKILESATLKLFIESNDGNWNSGQYVNIHRMTVDWMEGNGNNAPLNNFGEFEKGVSWNCPTGVENCATKWTGGNFDGKPTDSVFISNHVKDGYWIKFDVTVDIVAYLSGSSNYGWLIKKSNEDSSGHINFASREATSNIPELVMVFSK